MVLRAHHTHPLSSERQEKGEDRSKGQDGPWSAHTLMAIAQVFLTETASPEGNGRPHSLHHNSRELYASYSVPWFSLPSDAPGATPDAGWEGHIRATKRRTEAGDGRKGCTGKVSSASACGVLGLRMGTSRSCSRRAPGGQAPLRQLLLQESFCSLVEPPQEPRIPLSLVSQRFESRSRGTWLMASLSGANTWGAGSYRVPPAHFRDGCLRTAEDHYFTVQC